jgi:hypothetical protein
MSFSLGAAAESRAARWSICRAAARESLLAARVAFRFDLKVYIIFALQTVLKNEPCLTANLPHCLIVFVKLTSHRQYCNNWPAKMRLH